MQRSIRRVGILPLILLLAISATGEGGEKPVYLNLIWHQHQPLYVNPATEQMSGPWVRTHATKDYFDMAAMLGRYPGIHATFNLTSSLLMQIEHYVDRLSPFIDFSRNTIDADRFLRKWRGKTDPWIDLMLTRSDRFTSADRGRLYRDPWNCFSVSDVMIRRFPGYRALRERLSASGSRGEHLFTVQELRELKFWFYAAMFDPDFLQGPVRLPDGTTCDLSGFLRRDEGGRYFLRRPVTETDCRRVLVEAVKVMKNVVPAHRALLFDPKSGRGQIDVITTPFYHPILPLIYDSDLARVCQPGDTLPGRFAFPEDADAQVRKAIGYYRRTFGISPLGMWPGEGSVAQEILPILRRNGILWTASDVKVLTRSSPPGKPNDTPYRFPAGEGSIGIVFRDTDLSDRIGFTYQEMEAEQAAEDFVSAVLARAPRGESDALVTVILDGENAWEWYRSGDDGKAFLNALYRTLTDLQNDGKLITVTMSEYLFGNEGRGIPPHPPDQLPGMERLWPGSWINGNFDTWIGEPDENRAWEYLRIAREDLAASRIPPPNPEAAEPRRGSQAWYRFKAWEAMYAAEGSDWFWWYGSDQTAPGGEEPFDRGFRTHLKNVYEFARKGGGKMPVRDFPSISAPRTSDQRGKSVDTNKGGTMAR